MKSQQSFNRNKLAVYIAVQLLVVAPVSTVAAPKNGQLVAGQGSITQPTSTITQINQQSHTMVIDWSSFNVSANEQVNFIQPSSTASALNNIYDQNPSQIFGSINANGRVFLSNPNGLIFGPGSTVNVQSLVATGLNIDSNAFMAGEYSLQALQDAGAVINYGLINAATGGNVALLGGEVANHGSIIANYGHVVMASGNQMVVNFDGDGLINFQVNEQIVNNVSGSENAVHNTGQITADAGQVILAADVAADIFTNTINNEGLIQATRIQNVGGVIKLQSSDRTLHSGEINVTGENGQGGEVQILGNQVGLLGDASVDASGSSGGGVVLIGGDYQGNNAEIQNASQTYIGAEAIISADAIDSGNGGNVIVWADDTTQFYGEISVKGGSLQGDGGFVEVSGKGTLDFDGQVEAGSAHGENGTLLLDPSEIFIVNGADASGDQDASAIGAAPQLAFVANADTGNNEVSVGRLQALGNVDIELQATNRIVVGSSGGAAADVDLGATLTSATLTLSAGNGLGGAGDVSFNSGSSITTGGGNVTINAGQAGDSSGSATIGGITTSGGDVTINSLADVRIDGVVNVDTAATIAITTSNASSDVYSVDAADILNGGTVVIDSAGSIGETAALHVDFYADANPDKLQLASCATCDITVVESATTTIDLSHISITDLGTRSSDGSVRTIDIDASAANIWEINEALDMGDDNIIFRALGDIYDVGDVTISAAAITFDAANVGFDTTPLSEQQLLTNTQDLTVLSSGHMGVSNAVELTSLSLQLDPGSSNSNTYTLNDTADQDFSISDINNEGIYIELTDSSPSDINLSIENISAAAHGSISIRNSGIAAGAGTVSLIATDAITQQGGSVITADTLTGSAVTTVQLDQANELANLGAFTSTGGFTLNDNSGGLNISGAVSDASGSVSIATDGGAFAIGSNSVSGSSVALTSSGATGDITSTAGGSILSTGTTVALDAGRHISLAGTVSATTTATLGFAQSVAGTFSTTNSITSTGTAINSGTTGSTFDFSTAPAITATLTGTGGSDRLIGTDVASLWTLDATPTYSDGSVVLSFSNISNLQGGDLVDTFNVTAANSFNLDGGDGVDIFNIAALLTGTVDGEASGGTLQGSGIVNLALTTQGTIGFNGSTANISGGFSNIDTITGTGTGSLTGRDVVSSWTLNAAPFYNDGSRSLVINGFSTLQGGSAIDNFNLTVDNSFNLNGGAGIDVFNMGAILTGTVDGGADGGTLQGTGITDVSISGPGATTGVNGNNASLSSFSNITTITGDGTGTLTGSDNASIWTLAASTSYSDASGVTSFSGFTTLQGGSDIDTFNVTSATSLDLDGGDGVDVFDIGAMLTGTVDGEANGATLQGSGIVNVAISAAAGTIGFDANTVNVSGGASNISGFSGSGTFTGLDSLNIWTLSGTPTYSDGVASASISDFNDLQGGNLVDSFNVTADNSFNLNGGDGIDVFDIGAVLTGSVDGEVSGGTLQGSGIVNLALTSQGTIGFNGTTANITGGFSNIDSVSGAGTGSLTGRNTVSFWTLDGAPQYDDGSRSLTLNGFATLQGGSEIDTFNLTADNSFNLNGGDGVDVFDVGAILTGNIDGEASGATLLGSGISDITISGPGATTGVNGNNASLSSFSNITTITGDGTGTLTGSDNASIWTLAASTSYSDATGVTSFSGFTSLQGGDNIDTFNLSVDSGFDLNGGDGVDVFDMGAILTGNIDGEASGGTLQGSGITDVAISGPSGITGVSGSNASLTGFNNITNITGDGTGTLTGSANASLWTLAATASYNDAGGVTSFSGFTSLQGGNLIDTFNVTADNSFDLNGGDGVDVFDIAAELSGSIDGEASGGTLQGSGIVDLTLVSQSTIGFNGITANVTGGFSNIDSVTGAGTGTLIGRNTVSSWTLNGAPQYDDGSRSLTLNGFATLQGGSEIDTFNLTADNSFNLNGGDGVDVFDIGAVLTGSIDGEASGGTLQGSGIVNITLTSQSTLGFNGTTANVTGGFSNIDTVTGAGAGSFTGRDVVSSWTLDGAPLYNDGSRSLIINGFATLQGGSEIDNFMLTVDNSFNLNGGDGVDVFDMGAILTGNIDGGASGGTLQGSGITDVAISGPSGIIGVSGSNASLTGFSHITHITGDGTGTLTGSANASIWTLAATTNYNDAGGVTSFSGFTTLQGGNAIDTFNVTSGTTLDLNGGDGIDVFDIGAVLTGSIDGEASGGTLQGSGIVDLALTSQSTLGFNGTTANVTAGFSNIDTVTGAGTGSFTGRDVVSIWTLNGTPLYNDGSRSLDINGFASLQGGSQIDTFNVTVDNSFNLNGGDGVDVFDIGAVLTGSIDGEASGGTLQGTRITDVTISGPGGTIGVNGNNASLTSFNNITTITGDGTGTLTGADIIAIWTSSSANSGLYVIAGETLTFTGFSTWTGGNLENIFNLGHDVSVINGGDTENTYNLTTAITANFMGGAGTDEYVFDDGVVLTGSIDGAGGDDTLDLGSYSTALTFALAAGATDGSTGTATGLVNPVSAGFSNIDVITGGSGGNTFNVTGALTAQLTGGIGNDVLTLDSVPTFTTVSHSFTNENDGLVNLDGAIISYSNLESVADNLIATDRVFSFNGGSETIELTDIGGADSHSFIDSTLGQAITFLNPSDSLVVNASNGNDVIELNTLETGWDADISINSVGGGGQVNVISTLSAGATRTISITSGSIEGNGVTTDLIANTVNLNAVNGIGSSSVLGVDAAFISADSIDGNININSLATTDVVFSSLSTGSGLIQINQTTNQLLTLLNVDTTDASVTVSNTGGLAADILVGEINAGLTRDVVSLTASGSIDDLTTDLLTDITAFNTELNAVEGIGAIEGLELSVGRLTADTTNGNIQLVSTAASTVADSITTGVGSILLSNSGDMTLSLVETGNGLIDISSTAALTATNVRTGSDNNISLTADSLFIERVDAGLGIVDLTAGTTIQQLNSFSVTDVIASQLNATAGNGIDLDSDTDSVNLHVIAAGDIQLDNTGDLDLLDVDAADGTIRIRSTGQLTASDVTTANNNNISLTGVGIVLDIVDAGSGAVTLDSRGSTIVESATPLVAGQVNFNNSNGIGSSTNAFDLAAEIIRFDSGNTGAVYISNDSAAGLALSGNTQGLIELTEISGNTVTIQDGTSLISNNNTITLISDGLSLGVTPTGVINSGNGELFIRPYNNTQLINLGSQAGGTLSIDQAMLDQLISSGQLTIGSLAQTAGITLGGGFDVSASGNQLELLTDGAISDSGSQLIIAETVSITAGADIGSAGDAIDINSSHLTVNVTNAGNIDLQNSGSIELIDIDTVDGYITVSSTGQLVATDIQSGNDGDIYLSGNAIDVDYINAGGGNVLLNAATAITQTNVVSALDVVASQLTATSSTGFNLDTQITFANISDLASGTISLNNTGDLTLQDVDTADGSITVINSGLLTVSDVQTGNNNNVNLTGTGLLIDRLNAGAGSITLDANNGLLLDGTVSTVAGIINFQNSNGIGSDTNAFNSEAGELNFLTGITSAVYHQNSASTGVSVSGDIIGSIDLNESSGNLTIAASGLSSSDNSIQLSTDSGDILLTGDVNAGAAGMVIQAGGLINGSGLLSAANLDIGASTGIGSSDSLLQTGTAIIDFYNSVSGGSYFSNTAAGGVTVSSNNNNTGLIDFTETSGDLTINAVTTSAGGASFTAAQDVIISGDITAAADTITINSAGSINGSAALIADSLDLTAQSGIGNITPLVTRAAMLNFTNATNDVDISASLAAWNVSGNAGSGNINLSNVAGSLYLESLITTANINLDVASGSINDANAELINLTANSVTLIAGSGIGADDAIETAINELSFSNNSALAVQIINSSTPGLTVQQSSNAGAAISLTQSTPGGSLLINNELISNDGDISLISDNMDINLTLDPITGLPVGKVTAGAGAVVLSAFNSNQPIIVGGGSSTFSEAIVNNITTSGGLIIGSATHQAEVLIDGTIDTRLTVTGGTVRLLSDANVAVAGSLTNVVETSLVSGNGNILISGDLTSELNLTLQAIMGNIHFRDGLVLTSNTGNILLNTSGAIAGTGAATFNAATGLLASTDISMSGDILINVDLLNIENNITTTSGNLTITSANPVTINPGVLLNAAQTVDLPAFTANGDLLISGGGGVILRGESSVLSSGELNINSENGALQILANLTASGDVSIIASDLFIDTAAAILDITGNITISDPATGNGIALGAFQADMLYLDINEYNAIVAESILLQSSNNITLGTNFSSDISLVPLTINTNSLIMTGNTRIALASDLDFSSSVVDVNGELEIDVLGSFAMAGSVQTDGEVTVNADTGITMAANSSISSANSEIRFVTDTGDVRLGYLNAGSGDAFVTATTGDILNNHGVFLDVTQSKTNILASSATLIAQDRIGVSSTDAITLNIDAREPITLRFGASTAYINNLFSSPIVNLGSGTVAEGFVFSNQILGIGHNLGQNLSSESTVSAAVTTDGQQQGAEAISILGMDLLALLADDEEEDDFISSIVPSVPVMIRTQNGWNFKSPSRKQLLNRTIQRKNDGYKNIDWF